MKHSFISAISIILCTVIFFSMLTFLASCDTSPSNSSDAEHSQTNSESSQTDNESAPPLIEADVALTEDRLYDKISGSWVGQMVGVTWAASTEFLYNGVMIPEKDVPKWVPTMVNDAFLQDDLYVEVPFMEAMVKHGVDATIEEIAPYFRDSEFMLWHANEQGRRNLRNGIEPSLAGHYKYNHHADDIDWQIEADYLGNVFPGMPSLPQNALLRSGIW